MSHCPFPLVGAAAALRQKSPPGRSSRVGPRMRASCAGQRAAPGRAHAPRRSLRNCKPWRGAWHLLQRALAGRVATCQSLTPPCLQASIKVGLVLRDGHRQVPPARSSFVPLVAEKHSLCEPLPFNSACDPTDPSSGVPRAGVALLQSSAL